MKTKGIKLVSMQLIGVPPKRKLKFILSEGSSFEISLKTKKLKAQMKIKSAKQIVNENFKGLDELIEDKDLLLFYKELIEDCIEGYHEQFYRKKIKEKKKK